MGEDGGAAGAGAAPQAPSAPGAAHAGGHHGTSDNPVINGHTQRPNLDISTPQSTVVADTESVTSPRHYTPNPFSRKNTSLDIDDYFVCPPYPLTITGPMLTLATDRSSRHSEALKMAHRTPDARQHSAQADSSAARRCRLDHTLYMSSHVDFEAVYVTLVPDCLWPDY